MNNSRKIAGVVGMAGALWLGFTAAIAASQRRILFNPINKREVQNPRSSGHRTRSITLRAADGTRLHGWLMVPSAPGPHPGVVYFGGRSEEVSWVARDAGRLFPGMVVLSVNYRGYGDSHGEPAEQHLVSDGRILYDWLAESGYVDPERIAVVGRSLGSGVAVQVAKERPVRSVVLITPYDSILAIAKRKFRGIPIGYVLRHRFESDKHAATLSAPTYVLRAAFDDVVPHSHTDKLVGQLKGLLCDEIIPDSDHLNIPYLELTQQRIAEFLASQFRHAGPLPIAEVPAATPQIVLPHMLPDSILEPVIRADPAPASTVDAGHARPLQPALPGDISIQARGTI